MLDNSSERVGQVDEMIQTVRPTGTVYLRWPAQGVARPTRVVSQLDAGPTDDVTSSSDNEQTSPLAGSCGIDHPQRRSSGSSVEESDSDVETTYTCPCGKKFTRTTAYQRHLDVAHSNAESHQCSVCGKTFGNERTLTMHMSVHQDFKQFISTLERSSKSKGVSKSQKINAIVHSQMVKNKNDVRNVKMNNDSGKTDNFSINATSGNNLCSDDILQSSPVNFAEQPSTSCSEDESIGTDKENCSPRHAPSKDLSDSSDTLSSDSVNVPPLVNGKYHANSSLELDLTLPKSKTYAVNNEEDASVVSNSAKVVHKSSFISQYAERRNVTGVEPNKVSVITIKTDRSLLSESVRIRTKGAKTGDFVVNPSGHSVIVIKTQESKNKLNTANITADPKSRTESNQETQTIEIDNEDAHLVRKSQRLQGKVPGWKHILLGKEEILAGNLKRRKMAKVKVGEGNSGGIISVSEETQTEKFVYMKMNDDMTEDEPDSKRFKLSSPGNPCLGMVKSGVFKCPVCEKSFESEKYLSMHMSLHKVDNSMESLMSQNNKDDEHENNNVTVVVKTGSPVANGAFWTCKICNKVFAQNSNYKNHIRTHSDERPYVCQICSIGFKERYHLKKHMLFKHSDELKEECRFCGKKFKDSTAVRAHERIHSDDRPYSCRRCSKSFKTSECLWHHENRSKTCGQALLGVPAPSPRFKRGRQPKKEVKIAKNPPPGIAVIPMTCNGQHLIPATSLLFSGTQQIVHTQIPQNVSAINFNEVAAATASIQNLVPTTRVSENQLVKINYSMPKVTTAQNQVINTIPNTDNFTVVSSPAPVTTSPFIQPCPRTSNVVPTSNATPVLVKVEPEAVVTDYELTAMASSDGSFEDSNSDELLKEDPDIPPAGLIESETGLDGISHEAIMQVQEELKKDPVLEDIGMFLLGKSVTQEELSMDEDDDVLEEGEEPCDEYTFADNGKKLKDIRFACDKCGKQFVSAPAFDKHLLTHSGIRPYICNLCGVGFKLKVHLKKHCLYRHSDEKPCECSICGKKFKDSSAVRLHERIHSDDRPFHCECGKTFKTRENLWGHRHRGPCEKKIKFATDGSYNSFTALTTASFLSDVESSLNGPIYAQCRLGDTHVSAQAAISNNQIIARAIVSNNQMTAEASIGNNGQVTASASISGPEGKAEAKLDTSNHVSKADVEPTPVPQPVSVGISPCTDTTPVSFPRSVESRVYLPVLNTSAPSSGVPTAVVAPLMRETTAFSESVASPQSILKPIKIPSLEPPKQPELKMSSISRKESSETTLPPFETFSPKLRGHGPSLADRCPTIQKYLQMARQPIKLPGIQQLFQTHSLTRNPPNGLMQTGNMHESQKSLIAIRRTDPTAPLGPHPAQPKTENHSTAISRDSPHLSPDSQSPQPTQINIQNGGKPPRPPSSLKLPGTTETIQTAVSQAMVPARLTPTRQIIRSASPYPGCYGIPGLPMLLQTDPNLASTSGEGLTAQSPASGISLPVYWEDDQEKKVWQTEQEQLFQDLTQTTSFGQL